MKLPANTMEDRHLSQAKRIYLDGITITFTCPKCGNVRTYDNCVPIISYGSYCHSFYCDECGYESESTDKMYRLNEIGDDYIDVTFSDKNEIKVYELALKELEK